MVVGVDTSSDEREVPYDAQEGYRKFEGALIH